MKAYTDIEQSKKLVEILPLESADMKWYFWKNEIDTPKVPTFGYSNTAAKSYKDTEVVYLPCWSLSALLELIPTAIDEYTDDFSQLELTKQSVSYVYAIGNLRKGFLKDNLLDAAFETVVWLKENNKI